MTTYGGTEYVLQVWGEAAASGAAWLDMMASTVPPEGFWHPHPEDERAREQDAKDDRDEACPLHEMWPVESCPSCGEQT